MEYNSSIYGNSRRNWAFPFPLCIKIHLYIFSLCLFGSGMMIILVESKKGVPERYVLSVSHPCLIVDILPPILHIDILLINS